MLLVLKTLLGVFWTLLRVPLYVLLAFAALFGLACLLQAALLVARKGYRIGYPMPLKSALGCFVGFSGMLPGVSLRTG